VRSSAPADWARHADWAESCRRIIEAGAEGVERVFTVLVGTTRRLTRADGAAVVSWQAAGPRLLAVSGAAPRLGALRLAEGMSTGSGRSIASLAVQGETDLIVWWAGAPTGSASDSDAREADADVDARDADTPDADTRDRDAEPHRDTGAEDGTGEAPGADHLEDIRLLASLAAIACRPAGAALSSLYAVARQLLASREQEEVLLGLATATGEVLRAEIAAVFLATPDGESVQARAVVGHRTIETARLRVAKGESMVGHVFASGEVYRADDWTTDPVTNKDFLPFVSVEGTQACIGAPMRVDGEVVGVLGAWRRRRSLFTDDDVELLGTLADLAALGVQRAVADERLRDLSQQLIAANEALSQRYEEARQTLEIHQRLMRVVADGADLNAVVDALRSITDQEITFVGVEGTVVGAGGWLEALVVNGQGAATAELGEEAVLLGPDARGRHAISVGVRSAGLQWGRLAVATKLPAARGDVVATEQAAVACALLLSQQDAVSGAVRRLESEFVWDLLEGRILSDADAVARSRQLARELPMPARVIIFSADARPGPPRRGSVISPERIEHLRTELTRQAARVLATHGMHSQTGRRGDTLAMIVPDSPPDVVRQIGRELCGLGPELGRELSLGVSAPVHSIGQYPVAGRQAAYARAATRAPEAAVAVFEDLGAVQFLLEPAHGEDLDRYAEQQLGVLLAYDRDHEANLVNTLRVYLESDGHVQRAAEALCIHPKTMSYRLSRIEVLTGMVVGRQEDRFNAALALKILAIRNGGAAGPG
jgi:hypothetical protein